MREYLKKLREQHCLSQQDVAEKLGISRQYYSLIEDGERQKKMDVTLITALARVFGTTAEDILKNEQKLFGIGERR